MTTPLPEDLETEKILLTTICAEGSRQVALECCGRLQPEDFMHPAHRIVLEALRKILDEGSSPSYTVLLDAVTRQGSLGRVGGAKGLFEILDGVYETTKPMLMVDTLKRHRLKRDLIRFGNTITKQAEDPTMSPVDILGEAGAVLSKLAQSKEHDGIRPLSSISDQAMDSLERDFIGIETPACWLKGWSRLNHLLGGFKPGQLIILAARPGIGKTSLAMNWVLGVAGYRKSVGVFSLEMASDRLWRKLVGTHSRVDIRAMIQGRDQVSMGKVRQAREDLDSMGIWIEDRAEITPREIMGQVDGLIARQPNLGLLVVDYLGLITSPDSTGRKTESTRIGEITRAFKILASDRHIPVLLLSQMNREYEKRGPAARPMLSDLRDSGCVEQDADVVMFIHRHPEKTETELIIAKNREGPVGSIMLTFQPDITCYEELPTQYTESPKVFDLYEP